MSPPPGASTTARAPRSPWTHGPPPSRGQKFPSAANGAGFKPLADYVHAKGLKFGIHLMRGIPRQAVEKNLPILGTNVRAADIADTSSTCTWNTDMFGVDMSKPGGQAYYDSLLALFASWGVDFVKVDDISRPTTTRAGDRGHPQGHRQDRSPHRPQHLARRDAARPRRRTSPARQHVAHQRRLLGQRGPRFATSSSASTTGRRIARPARGPTPTCFRSASSAIGRTTQFTPDEQRTMMTLWSIARSPLMLGGDMTKLDDVTLALLTNDEVLAVNQASEGNRQLFEQDDLIAWVADVPGSKDKYLAVFNAGTRPRARGCARRGAVGRTRLQRVGARARPVGWPRGRQLLRGIRPGGGPARRGTLPVERRAALKRAGTPARR